MIIFAAETGRQPCEDIFVIRLTRLFLVRWQQGHMRYKFSRLTILHRFFEGLNFHIFYPASAVTLLFYSGSYSEAGTASSPQQQQ